MSERIEIFELIERLDAASRDETLSDGMLYRAAAERLAEYISRDVKYWHSIMQRTDKQADRTAELEAENRIFRNSESVGDSVWDGMLKAIMELQAKLDRVRGLPEKWRDISYKTTDAYTNLHGCADELESTLGDEE